MQSYGKGHPDEEGLPLDTINQDWRDHDDEEVLQSVSSVLSNGLADRDHKHTQVQCEDTEIEVPRERTSRGRISGPYTHGTTLMVPPKMSM